MEIVPLLNIHYLDLVSIDHEFIATHQATFQIDALSCKIGNIWRHTILLERRSSTTDKD
ncbi:MAG: hypothetical protein JNJ40_07785 [Bacteroidia bacterium]|nr:hypothetical protein [Bacteroidia bacterium]